MPKNKNIKNIINELAAKANPTAVPKKGAEQGVDNNVAKAPSKKDFPYSLLSINLLIKLLKLLDKLNLIKFSKFAEKIIRILISIQINIGCWNWIPQPTSAPKDFNI